MIDIAKNLINYGINNNNFDIRIRSFREFA